MIQWTTSVVPETQGFRSAFYSDSGPQGPGAQGTISYSFSSFGTTSNNWSATEFAEARINGLGRQGKTILGNTNSVIFFTTLNFNTPPATVTTGTSSTRLSTAKAQTSTIASETFQAQTTLTSSWARFIPIVSTFFNNGITSGGINFVSTLSTRLTSRTTESSRTIKATTTLDETYLNNVLAATIYEAEDDEIIFAAEASIAPNIYMGAAHEVASTFTRVTVMPITDTYELTVIDLSPSTNEETSSQAPAISTYSSADVDVTKTYEIFANNGTASSSSIIEFLAIPQITTTIPINQLAIATQTSSRRVFESFNREISYTSSEETQSGMSLSTVSGFFSNSVYSNIYEAVTTRTINAQAAFETSLSSTFSESNPNTNAFDYGRTVSEGENKTVISQNINQARTTKFFSSPRRTIKKLTGVRNNADLVVGFYAAQGIAGSTFYPDFNDGLAIYPLASRNVHTVHPRTYRYFTDPFDESEAGTISISGLNGSGTNQFGTFTFALIPSGSANTTSVVLADSIGIGVANLGKFETAYQSISAGVYSRFGGTVRYESPQFLSFANEQSAAVEKLIPITGFTTETFLFRNAYSMIWTAPRNSVDLPPDMP